MLRFGMLCLICSVSSGVFAFGAGHSSPWAWGQVLFFVCLAFSAVGFLGGLFLKPAALQEARVDDRASCGPQARDTHGTGSRE